jgi:hypothetical protein
MPPAVPIRENLVAAIRKAHPQGVVDLPRAPEESYLTGVCAKLRAQLRRIKGAAILYEHDATGETGQAGRAPSPPGFGGRADADVEDDWGEGDPEYASSYSLFFVGLAHPALQQSCEIENDIDPEEDQETVEGKITYGWAVGISLLAPWAIVVATDFSEYEDGTSTVPDIEEWYQDDKGRRLTAEEFYRAELDAPILEALDKLRAAIIRVLDSFSISVLPASEASKPVPWLRAGEETLLGQKITGHPLNVQDALFFRRV